MTKQVLLFVSSACLLFLMLGIFLGKYLFFSRPLIVPTPPVPPPTPTIQPTPFPLCGTIRGLVCPTGYTCQMEGNYPDASGTCIPSSPRPTSSPSPVSVHRLSYILPSGWQKTGDCNPFGCFEIGYDPATTRPDPANSNYFFLSHLANSSKPNIGLSFISVGLMPYAGGSRHQFIYDNFNSGIAPGASDKAKNYTEKEYVYNGKSCLFLEGVYISQGAVVWGMCDAGGGIAFVLGSYSKDYLPILQTLKKISSEPSKGTLSATITSSPTCAGPQQIGENCSGPYANQPLNIFKSSGQPGVTQVTTDSQGKFSVGLSPGNYYLQSPQPNRIGSLPRTDFSIVSGKTTPLNLTVDTGIR